MVFIKRENEDKNDFMVFLESLTILLQKKKLSRRNFEIMTKMMVKKRMFTKNDKNRKNTINEREIDKKRVEWR